MVGDGQVGHSSLRLSNVVPHYDRRQPLTRSTDTVAIRVMWPRMLRSVDMTQPSARLASTDMDFSAMPTRYIVCSQYRTATHIFAIRLSC